MMDLKFIFLYTIFIIYFTKTNANTCTKPNERFCNNVNRCESACTSRGLINFQKTKSNCICIKGFARNRNGNCIKPEMCGEFCGPNEELDRGAIEKNAPCSSFCKCKQGFNRVKGACVKCNFTDEEKSRCELFDSKACCCTKCLSEFKLCNGRCFDNHKNCKNYEGNESCKCVNCEPGFKIVEGVCVKDIPFCTKFKQNGTCIACDNGKTLCDNRCFSDCTDGKIFEQSQCSCVCPPKTHPCESNCIPECTSLWQVFSPTSCKCECREGSFACGNSCHPYVNNCASYKNDTCKCEYCNPGFKICNGECVPFQCGVNEYFVDAICKCDCVEGYFRNEQGICTCTENNIGVSIFYRLFLELIFSFLPPKQGYCRENEFYSSWPLKSEETCRGPRVPNPTENCFCRSGFIRDIRTHTCLKVCPLPGLPCDTNEVYECGPERYCSTKPSTTLKPAIRVESRETIFASALTNNKKLIAAEPEVIEKPLVPKEAQNTNKETVVTKEKALLDTNATVPRTASADVEVLKEVSRTNVPRKEVSTNKETIITKEKSLLDANATVPKTASADVEVLKEVSKTNIPQKEARTSKETIITKEKSLLDVNATVNKVASADVEVLKEVSRTNVPQKEAPTNKETVITKEKSLLDVNATVSNVASANVEVLKEISRTSDPKSKEVVIIRAETSGPENNETTTESGVTVQDDIDDENIPSKEEFCGYHCREGFGRVGSVCKQCGAPAK